MAPPDRWRLADRRLYLCTPDRPDLEQFVDACIAGGVDDIDSPEALAKVRQYKQRMKAKAKASKPG
jgi:thiamine-phosphate pyrophosphorylase